ncbi:HEPN domain-containing protein [Bacillus subtilis]|nr:HEPN domain-containing protein [Bacillus subtilis]
MKYRFITIMHNLKLEGIKNKGIQLDKNVRLSNGTEVLRDTIETDLMRVTCGVHSISEFEDKAYIYIDGEFDETEQADEIGTKYTFYLLREAQRFTNYLWKIKDNNVYVRDGFLIVYDKNLEDGVTFKASLSEVFSHSTCEQKESLFSDIEIASAKENFNLVSFQNYNDESYGGKSPDSNHLFKSHDYTRFDRALYFILGARRSSILPMKIMYYCNAFECLFTTGKTEISHQISERVASMLGTKDQKKLHIYNQMKAAYSVRSTIVHGQAFKSQEKQSMATLSKDLDDYLRELINAKHEVFYSKDRDMNKFFIGLLLS